MEACIFEVCYLTAIKGSGISIFVNNQVNWYKNSKDKEDHPHPSVLDSCLLCCGYPENRRKDEYKRNKKPNYPSGKNNEIPNGLKE